MLLWICIAAWKAVEDAGEDSKDIKVLHSRKGRPYKNIHWRHAAFKRLPEVAGKEIRHSPSRTGSIHFFLRGDMTITLITLGIVVAALAWLMLTKPHPELPPMSPERQRELLIALREHRKNKAAKRRKK